MGSNTNEVVTRLARLHRREDGMFSAVQLVVVLFFALMAAFFFYIVYAVEAKTRWQNAADSSARAAATAMARGMNAVCVSNHLIGESVGLLIVHEAVAGPTPGSNGRRHPEDSELDRGYRLLQRRRGSPPTWKSKSVVARWRQARAAATPVAYGMVSQLINAEATVQDAKRRLKDELADAYKDMANAIYRYAYTGSGMGIIRQGKIREAQVQYEYGIMNLVEAHAVATLPANRRLKRVAIPELRGYVDSVVREVPELAVGLAESLAEQNAVKVALTPARPELPLERDPLVPLLGGGANLNSPLSEGRYDPLATRERFPREGSTDDPSPSDQIAKVTQLSRASFPWVIYHREPMLEYLRSKDLKISKAADLYFDETAGTAKSMLKSLQQSGGLLAGGLYVPRGATLVDKGFERWTNDPSRLAGQFGVTCRVVDRVAGGETRSLAAAFFRTTLPAAPTATATAVLYNGNQQQPHAKRVDLRNKRIVPVRQPKVGWDTLQWRADPERTNHHRRGQHSNNGMPFELVGAGSVLDPNYVPRAEVAWQARLVPVAPGVDAAGDALLAKHAAVVTH